MDIHNIAIAKIVLTLVVLCLIPVPTFAQASPPDRMTGKSLEAASAFAQSLSQWEFAIIGGSLLTLIGTSHHRPKTRGMRAFYLLFLPAWGFLGKSIYMGTRAQEAFLAYSLLPTMTISESTKTLNSDINWQIRFMWIGLFCLAIWLLIYVFWWVFADKISDDGAPV